MKRNSAKKSPSKVLDVSMGELLTVVERAKVGALNAEDHQKLAAAISTLEVLMEELKNKATSTFGYDSCCLVQARRRRATFSDEARKVREPRQLKSLMRRSDLGTVA